MTMTNPASGSTGDKPRTVIYRSRLKTGLDMILPALLAVGGLWIATINPDHVDPSKSFDAVLWLHVFGYVTAGLGVFTILLITRKLFDSSPGLILDGNGMETSSTGLIPWKDIKGFSLGRLGNLLVIYVNLKFPALFIEQYNRGKRPLRKIRPANSNPVLINPYILDIKLKDLAALLEKYLPEGENDLDTTPALLRWLKRHRTN